MTEFDYFKQCCEMSEALQEIKRRFIKQNRSIDQSDAVQFAAQLLAFQDDLHNTLAGQ